MTASATDRQVRLPRTSQGVLGGHAAMLMIALIALAAALRLFYLGRWTLEGDEIFTLRDSLVPRLSNPRPLFYLLNHYLVLPFRPLDEFGLRLLAAVFGVLAVPALYLVARRLVGTRPALFGTFLLAVSNLHIYHSQYARYWSLVFLFSAVYPFAIYLGIRHSDRRLLALGLLTGVLAALAHPVSVLLVGGLALWLAATHLRRDTLVRLWKHRGGRWGVLLIVMLGAVIALQYIPVLYGWIAAHDAPVKRGEHLLHLPSGVGVKQAAFFLSYIEGLTLPLVLTGAIGIYQLWLGRERQLAGLLLCLFGFPTIFLILLSLRTAVSTSYLLPTTPVFFIGAGVFLDWLAGLDRQLRPRWLLPATVTALVILPGMPTLISQYRDGRRHDFRGAARWLEARVSPGDLVFSDQYQVLGHYLPTSRVARLTADPLSLAQMVRTMRESGEAVWIVAPGASHSFRTNPRLGSLMSWIYQHCQLRNAVGVARLDFRQNQLLIYRCPAPVDEEPRATPE
jgi:hypothetical protein